MIVLDENLPPALATFLETLGEPARHVRDLNLQGVTDETILQELVAGEDCLITKDRAMLRRPDIIALWQQRRLGLIVFPNSNLRAIESSQLLLTHWARILILTTEQPRPFLARIPLRGPLYVERRPGAG